MSVDDLDAIEQQVLDSGLLEHILERHRRTAGILLAEAATQWILDGCPRYDDREASCTATLVGRMLQIIDARKSEALQPMVTLETGQWSEEHFAGTVDPTKVPRPDVVIWLGLQGEARMNIECKRFLAGSATAHDYVEDGVCRFLNGRYTVDQGVGLMVGFLLDREPPTAAEQVSAAILEVITRDEPLVSCAPLAELDSVYRSIHAAQSTSVELIHLLLAMQ